MKTFYKILKVNYLIADQINPLRKICLLFGLLGVYFIVSCRPFSTLPTTLAAEKGFIYLNSGRCVCST